MVRYAVATLVGLLLLPATASAGYDPAGVYLDSLTRAPIADRADVRFDGAGIPQLKYGGAYFYSPVTISQYGLQEFSYNAAGRGAEHLAAALRAADWLVANQQPLSGAWTYHYDFPVSGMGLTLRAPWISAMAQGQAMSLLTRAWRRTGDAHYLTAADAALAPFHLAVADGGVVTGFLGDDSRPYFEEFPTQPASLTLNGFMFSLLGLYDLDAAAPGGDAGKLFEQGFDTLVAALPRYDTGGVSAYHLGYLTNPPQKVHTSLRYHWIHVVELAALASVRPDPVLTHYHDVWAAYKPPPPPPPPPPAAPAPQPVVTNARLVRPVRAGAHRVPVRFELSAPGTLTLALARRIHGRWRVRGERTVVRGAGRHTVGVYRRGRGPLRAGVYRVVVTSGTSVARVRFRCAQRLRSSGSTTSASVGSRRSSRS